MTFARLLSMRMRLTGYSERDHLTSGLYPARVRLRSGTGPDSRDLNQLNKLAHKIFRLLKNKGLLSDERIELLLSFRNSGFSVDTSPTVWPQDTQGLERLCRYLLRCPVSLSRIHWTPGAKTLFYESKQHANDDPLFSHPKGETLDIFEFIARVLTQIPEPRAHGVRYFGAYSSRTRAHRKKRHLTLQSLGADHNSTSQDEPELLPKKRAAVRKSSAQLIRRVYLTDPLKCECGGTLRVISFITEQKVILKILDHFNTCRPFSLGWIVRSHRG